MNKIGNYINGKHITNNSSKELSVFDPSTGEECAKVSISNLSDFNEVINSSIKSFYEWSSYTSLIRSRILST